MKNNQKIRTLLLVSAIGSFYFGAVAHAATASRLGEDLTPMGAERAGNAEGTIPAWTGGLSKDENAVDPESGYKNPFAGETPIFTITADNLEKYKENLSDGQVAMLKRYPDTWKLPVYPTHRSASYPQEIYDAVRSNVDTASLENDGNSVSGVNFVTPFPIAENAKELMWNHLMRYRGRAVEHTLAGLTSYGDDSFKVTKNKFTYLFNKDVTSEEGGKILFYYLLETLLPAREAGTLVLVHDTVDPLGAPRQSWLYSPGQRRVRRAPTVVYDTPTAGGMITVDDSDVFSGAMDRYDWELVGKKELYVPYNNYELASKQLGYSDIMDANHINPELARHELHRVWHVRAKLKPDARHIYAQRDFYLDEDTYQIVLADSRDVRGELWRVSSIYTINFYDQPLLWSVAQVVNDLVSGRYIALGMSNEEDPYDFSPGVEPQDFTPSDLRRSGFR